MPPLAGEGDRAAPRSPQINVRSLLTMRPMGLVPSVGSFCTNENLTSIG